jgi:NAD+ diphosphatase
MLATFPPPDDRFSAGCEAVSAPPPADALWCFFRQGELLLSTPPALLGAADVTGLAPLRVHHVGRLDGRPVLAADLAPSSALPPGLVESNLRAAATALPAAEWTAAALASQVLHWDRTNRFCGACGARTAQPDATERALRCTQCGHIVYPRIAPCIIVLVHDGARMLLTRQASWPAGRYGLVAGFVEAGESLEACVAREVGEETGLAVGEITYAGSQPWPFPHQLMVGFYARYAGGEVELRDGELEDARWFEPGSLPVLPPRLSIARSLIEQFIQRGA